MTANRVETGTKEERMTIKSKRGGGGGGQRILQSLSRGGGSSKSYRDTNKILRASLPPQVIKLTGS